MTFREKWEREAVDEVSVDELMRHTAYLSSEDRESGSPGEARALRYFKEFMEKLGFEALVLEIENFILQPWIQTFMPSSFWNGNNLAF